MPTTKKVRHGFVKKKANFGYRPRRNGSFEYVLPKVTPQAMGMPHNERMKLLLDRKITDVELGRKFGISYTTAWKWRTWIAKLRQEDPKLLRELATVPFRSIQMGKEYYRRGPEKLRLNYELTNVAMRGIQLWLAMDRLRNRLGPGEVRVSKAGKLYLKY
ncbi:MAG TPA: hypothetical protein VJH23_02170 [archaeon]|nr:hypothetical protein [archaeon]